MSEQGADVVASILLTIGAGKHPDHRTSGDRLALRAADVIHRLEIERDRWKAAAEAYERGALRRGDELVRTARELVASLYDEAIADG